MTEAGLSAVMLEKPVWMRVRCRKSGWHREENRIMRSLSGLWRGVAAGVLAAALAAPLVLPAQTHVVSLAEMRKEALTASRAREADLEAVGKFLSTPKAEEALRAVGMNPGDVKAAAATLSDEEVAKLASRAAKAQMDFAAGALTDRDLILILVGIAVIILIIVAVD
jgi:hypothetical protein